MAKIKPFNAVLPKSGFESKIAALPYDVYSRKEAKEFVKDKPLSFLNIDRPETQFDDDFDMYSEEAYLKARSLYVDMKDKGYFIKEEKPCFFLYEETMGYRSQTGLVCVASVDDYKNNIIKKHENTRKDKEIDRIKHVDMVNAQTGPIFLAYKDVDVLNLLFDRIKKEEPLLFDFESEDGIIHRGWKIEKDADVKWIQNEFDNIPSLYIADGHHRCASAVKVSDNRQEKNPDAEAEDKFFLSVVFPESELYIMDYNRVVKDLNGLTVPEFLEKLEKVFEIDEIEVSDEKPAKKGEIFMLLENKEYVLLLKDEYESDDPVKTLDVSKLQDYVLDPILGIKDPKTDKRIDFVGGIRGIKELRRRINEDCKVAFAMHPTLMSELFNIADAGLLMPPKSTWFEPKLRSGLFIHELE